MATTKKFETSAKHVAINKANAEMVAVIAVACFVTIFCLFAAKAVWGQTRYQARVITAKEKAHTQLQSNLSAFGDLQTAYAAFDNANSNVIGGLKTGTGDKDGSNSKIVLDALPTTYDFPALASSIEKILTDRHFQVSEIKGTDDQVNQQTNLASPEPKPVEIPFSFTVQHTDYASVQQLIAALQQSIRPIQVDTLDISGSNKDMSLSVTAHTYYQPAKSVNISKKVIK